MTWRETSEGIELMYDAEGSSCDGTSACSTYDAIDVTTDNATQITNNISVLALTGENKIEGAGGDAEINTGDAFAAANTINVANTNVIGKNWMMAVINIFGDWNGNISFGVPNLWVGAKAALPVSNPVSGTSFKYEYTVMNTGDADAKNVCVNNRFNHRLLELGLQSAATDREVAAGNVEYCIGTVKAGEVREFSRSARVKGDIPYGTTYITNNIEVQPNGGEVVLDDNHEVVTFDVWRERYSTNTGGTRVEYKPSPKLTISKVNASPFFVRASSTVDYRVMIANDGAGPAYEAVLIDTLYNDAGEKIYEEHWNLGEIYAGEEIEVFYTTFFNDATEEGVYTNTARIEALGGYHTFLYGHDASTGEVSSSIKVVPNPMKNMKSQETIEVIEESKEVVETVETQVEETQDVEVEVKVAVAVPRVQEEIVFGPYHGPLYYEHDGGSTNIASSVGAKVDHPLFTQHPAFVESGLGMYLDHPLFTQHPIYYQYTVFYDSEAWYDNIAGVGLLKLLTAPLRNISQDTKSDKSQASGEDRNILALLALSMFVLRKPVSKKED